VSTALYRRYRPETFADVIGQEHVTEPLMQALRSGRVHHAYLFSGPRGCGKTTSARILARCLNCEQGPTPEPCGTCDSCVALSRGGAGSVDVIEIDAASHGGVDDARDLRERAAFGPAQSRFKVYIIDEAHMVSPQGFNALLKVVEEPPEHVKFIFATTEPEKVISTIRSRTHHYPFHLVPPQRLTAYLEQVCEAEGVPLEPGVLSFVTRAGGGSVRDSLSVLDQLIAGAGEEGLTYERTAALLGFTDTELLDAVVDAVAARDAAGLFTQVDKVMESGHDPRRFVEDLLERYRDLIVVSAVGERTGGLLRGLPDDQVARLRQQASVYGPAELTRCADIVSRGLAEMTGAVSYRIHLELICARLLLPGAEGEHGYATRLERIERRLATGAPATAQSAAPAAPVQPASRAPRPAAPEPGAAATPRPAAAAPTAEQPTPAPAVQQATAPAGGRTPVIATEPPADRSPAAPTSGPEPTPAEPTPTAPTPTPPPAAAPGSLDTEAVRRAWPAVLDKVAEIKRVTWTYVSNAQVLDYDGRRVLLGIDNIGKARTFAQRGIHAEVVRQAFIDAIGLDAVIEGVPLDDPAGAARASAPAAPPPVVAAPPPEGDPPTRPGPAASERTGVAGPPRPSAGGPEWSAQAGTAPPAWATEGPSGGAPPKEPAAGDDEPSRDDEDLESSGAVGQPVVESVLGGTVIRVDDELNR